ncbi:MAG TPA: hypothetical protein VEV87_01705 [Chitinophagaceae bacterium]|nr:hypothetical protein [Chitinophagaceae bacterium]
MKRLFPKMLIAVVKSISLLLAVGLLCTFSLALKTKELADDVWKRLGLSQVDGNLSIYHSVQNGNLVYYTKSAKSIAQGDRLAVINQLVAHSKKYIASDEFKRKYENERKLRMPAAPQISTISADSIRRVEKARIEAAIKYEEGNANHPNSKVRNAVPYRIENLKKDLKAVDDPNNKRILMIINQAEAWNTALLNQYKKDLQKLDTDLPPNPRDLIKRRLQEILDITAEVDYDAELMEVGKYKKFVNPLYEKKSKDWKLAFRAGRQNTEAVREIAKEWLEEFK